MLRSITKRLKSGSRSDACSKDSVNEDSSHNSDSKQNVSSVNNQRHGRSNSNVSSQYHSGSRKTSGKTASATTSPLNLNSSKTRQTTKQQQMEAMLASFDACVLAADSLGAAEHHQQEASILSARKDPESGLVDCSVLISPDGDLLLVPQSNNFIHNTLRKVKSAEDNDIEKADDDDEQQQQALFSQLIAHGKDDYDSAIFFGNDLQGDKALNGFSAKGWSIPATSHALYQTEAGMQHFGSLCHAVMADARSEMATETLKASLQWRSQKETCSSPTSTTSTNTGSAWRSAKKDKRRGHHPSSQSSLENWELIDPRASDFEYTADRVGPFLAPQSTLHTATQAVETYFVRSALRDVEQWKEQQSSASDAADGGDSDQNHKNNSTNKMTGKEMLRSLDKATEQMSKRVLRRQQALEETSRKVRLMEDHLVTLKQTSDRSWEAVYEAEAKVTKKVEQVLKDRSREREKQRLAQLREQEKEQAQHVAAGGGLGTTSQEIWDIVNSVAESMDDGSFEPMDMPSAPIKAPRDQSKVDAANDADDLASLNSADRSETLPMVSREAIEHEVGLPELRMAAMRADDDIQDAAQGLLQILSKLDTARRSARAAAETSLVAAGNMQAKCIKTWVGLEREALEERLTDLKAVEEAVDRINVRSDLDVYISSDKKDKGGVSHLGDDDDGGVASALATLSSHIEGIMGNGPNYRQQSMSDVRRDVDDGPTLASLDKHLEKIFEDTSEATSDTSNNSDKFDAAVEALCKTALDESPLATARRSALCYALNAKRSSNAEIRTKKQFDGLCRIFGAILTGCNSEEGGVTNAKMCIMLAQTFYVVDKNSATEESTRQDASSPSRQSRSKRTYIRSALQDHPIWSKDDFWDEALSQQISEALTQSGVMSNFEKQKVAIARKIRQNSEWAQTRKTKWHDLNSTERVEAASQVHAVVFAQLGALAHSMIEFGCGLERSCAFVRRMSIRNQLPSSHRIMLLKHLMAREDGDNQTN